jgi:hypothetical protein
MLDLDAGFLPGEYATTRNHQGDLHTYTTTIKSFS